MGLLLVVALLLFTYAPQTFAETGSIGIAPAFPKPNNARSRSIFILTLKAGDVIEDGVRVYNYTNEPRTVLVDAVDSISATDGSFSCKQNSEKKTAVGAWMKLESKEVIVQPKSNELVKFTVTAPNSVGPGEHGACITAQDTKNVAAKSGAGVLLGFRNAIRVAITVPGKIVKDLSIEKVDVARNEKGNYTVSPISKNNGNVSLDVKARVQLRSFFGQETEVKSADYPIIAGTTTGWAFEFKQPFWGGFYRAYTSLTYNADPSVGLGEQANTQEKKVRLDTRYFFMMPKPQALAVELGAPLFGLAVLFTVLRRRRARRTAHKRLLGYAVQSGDTITSIASAYNCKWKRLAKLNGLKAPYMLRVGQTVYVPKTTSKKRKKRSSWEDVTDVPLKNIETNQLQPVAQLPIPTEPTKMQDWAVPVSTIDLQASQPEPKPVVPSQPRVIMVQARAKSKKSTKKSKRYSWASPSTDWSPLQAAPASSRSVRKTTSGKKKTVTKKAKKSDSAK